eukprot:13430248-Alexandrium_andersonii.AAC.1
MSASLVGSEMCIRDRVFLQSPCHRPQVRGQTGGEGQGRCSQVGPQACPLCLLYTSDAADDM